MDDARISVGRDRDGGSETTVSNFNTAHTKLIDTAVLSSGRVQTTWQGRARSRVARSQEARTRELFLTDKQIKI